MAFPKNPKNGDTVTVEDGVVFIYDSTLNIWHEQEGGTIALATPLASGLMSSDDFKKLSSLIVPPPQSTITVADYEYAFSNGMIALKEGDDFVKITGDAKISNSSSIARQIHQNTYAFNFTIDTTAFIRYMVDSGRFVVRSPQGPQGEKGDTGPRGQDNLPYGPDGAAGDAGANAPTTITIQPEPASLERVDQDTTLAVTSIATEEISEDENYLVVTRSIIGNPDACPSQLRLSSTASSNWLVALPNIASQPVITWLPDTCHTDSQQVYYIDVSNIIESIKTEFNREVAAIKEDCENIVEFWLSVMAGVFDEQKAALCCALEYCESQSRNAETRRYIEEQRIQAAQAVTLKGGTTTSISYTDAETGQLTTVTNETINSTAQKLVIDGDPYHSGKSVVNTTVMGQQCGSGYGSNNVHNLPNNQDPVGGSTCIPGIVLTSDGKALKYDECPPGFIPRYIERDAILNVTEPEVPYLDIPSDYSITRDIPETGSGSSNIHEGTVYGKITPGVNLYLPPGISLARKLAINAFRSNNPSTSSELRVTITGDILSQIKGVTVYVKSLGNTILAYGQTDSNGDIYFKNLSSKEQYNITLEKSGYIFTPDSWNSVSPQALLLTELQSTITSGVETTPLQQIVKCSSGSNILVVTVSGDAEGINSTWVSIRYYSTGFPLCSAYAGTSTTNKGEIVFTGIPDGLWIVYAGIDETSETDTNYYTVEQPCSPVANPISQQAVELRSCRTVKFNHRTDGGQNLARMTFEVTTHAKPASGWIMSSSIPAELITPNDARFESLVKQQIAVSSGTTLSEALSPFSRSEPVSFKLSHPDCKIYYTQNFGDDYNNNLGEMSSKDGEYFDKFFDGTYNICIVNGSNTPDFRIDIATRNAKFTRGSGDGWSDSFIGNNSIVAPKAPNVWWLQFKVNNPARLQQPYSEGCGAIGPRISKTDKRFCRELPNGSGSPLTRDFIIGDGSISQWQSGKCGLDKAPDAIAINISAPFLIDNLILCRVSPNAYSGGFNLDSNRSAQVIIQQITYNDGDAVTDNNYRCTILGWNTNDCVGDISNFGSTITAADCSNWSLDGAWSIAGTDVRFNAKSINNLYDDGIELILDINNDNDGFFKSVSSELPRGDYVVDIVDCCIRSGDQYTGHIEIEYQTLNGKVVKRLPNYGASSDNNTARNKYRGLTLEISHTGGSVGARLVSPILLNSSGSIQVRITTKDKFVENNRQVEQMPQVSQVDTICSLSYAQIEIMEQVSRKDRQVVDIAGQDYIIVRQNIGGAQECTRQFKNVVFVWPTLDGVTFAGIPSSGIVSFKRSQKLEEIAKTIDRSLGVILFPVITT